MRREYRFKSVKELLKLNLRIIVGGNYQEKSTIVQQQHRKFLNILNPVTA
jgi:hypothetical protein